MVVIVFTFYNIINSSLFYYDTQWQQSALERQLVFINIFALGVCRAYCEQTT